MRQRRTRRRRRIKDEGYRGPRMKEEDRTGGLTIQDRWVSEGSKRWRIEEEYDSRG